MVEAFRRQRHGFNPLVAAFECLLMRLQAGLDGTEATISERSHVRELP